MLERGDATILDVRGHAEWEAGHLPGVANIPVGYLADRIAELPTDTPLIVQCQAGGRSSIAASLLESKGFSNVINLAGGYTAWQYAGLPTEREDAAARTETATASV
jgi:hydroxyacylglutathione hydrolase